MESNIVLFDLAYVRGISSDGSDVGAELFKESVSIQRCDDIIACRCRRTYYPRNRVLTILSKKIPKPQWRITVLYCLVEKLIFLLDGKLNYDHF